MNNSIFSNPHKDTHRTPDGKTFKSEQAAQDYCDSERQRLGESIGRPISDVEWRDQQIKPAYDSRTHRQQADDSHFAVKLADELNPLQQQIAKAEADLATKQANRERDRMSYEESALLTLKNRAAREAEKESNAKALEVHQKAIAPKLAAIDKLIADENWSTNSDAGFREQLRQARETLVDPGHDPRDMQQRLQAIDSVLTKRAAVREAELMQQQEQAEATLVKIREERGLFADPEPETEHKPSPHSYPDPMADRAETEAQPEPLRVEIDRTQSIRQQIMDLGYKASMADWPTEVRREIFAARDALKEGDEKPALDILSQYGATEA